MLYPRSVTGLARMRLLAYPIQLMTAMLLLIIVGISVAPPSSTIKLPLADINVHSGKSFILLLKMTPWVGFRIVGDAPSGNYSKLRLWEENTELGPKSTVHAEIAEKGGGRFSHWGDYLYF